MRKLALLAMATLLPGCVGTYYPGQAYQQATFGGPPPQSQPYQPQAQPVQVAQDLAPHDYEHTKDIEVREKVRADDAWCGQPYVAATLREIRSMRIEIAQRRAHEMAREVENGPFHPDLITTIVGMTGGEHHCIGLSRDECIGDGSKHVCRGLVMQERHEPVWTEFVIEGEHFDNAIWRRDEVQH